MIEEEKQKDETNDLTDDGFEGETSAQRVYLIRHGFVFIDHIDELNDFLQLSPTKKPDALDFWVKKKATVIFV